jgi:hypothetical protein
MGKRTYAYLKEWQPGKKQYKTEIILCKKIKKGIFRIYTSESS